MRKTYPKTEVVNGRHQCPECPKDFSDRSGFRYHWRKYCGSGVIETPKTEKEWVKDEFGLTPKQLERILIAKKSIDIKPFNIQIGETYTFGAMADNHSCSSEERLEALHTYYHEAKKRGVEDVYNAGDVLAGQGVYRGQEYELHTFGADNQVSYLVKNYPRERGITTHFVTGNHDYAFYKQIGLDVGIMIAERRDDMNYLGPFQGDVMYKGIPLIRVVHPDGGMAYALSYRMQKYVEQISSGKKPRIIISGHQHTAVYFLYRNIHVVQAGAFEGQTKLILRKGINPSIGGWIITIKLAKDKHRSIVSFVPEFLQLEY
jgi:predicted phosphodiesterase